MVPIGGDHRLLLDRQHVRSWCFRARSHVCRRSLLPPLSNGILIDPIELGKCSQILLTILCCSTNRLSCCGASMKNPGHSASFQPGEKIAPSKPRIKQLGSAQIARQHKSHHRAIHTRSQLQLRGPKALRLVPTLTRRPGPELVIIFRRPSCSA